jgi:hypothetical protein
LDGASGNTEPTTTELPSFEVGGWLIDYQRARCEGGSPLDTYQGVVADEIVIPESAWTSKDPAAAVRATVQFADIMQNQAMFLPGEFAQEASWCFYLNDYLGQVSTGGHGQYFVNRGDDEIALKCSALGMKSMLADPHLALFNLFMRVRRGDQKIAEQAAKKAGYKSAGAAIRDFDNRFAEVDAKEQLMERQKRWLNSLRKLKVVPDAEYKTTLERLASSNGLMHARRSELERRRAGSEVSDPVHRLAKALCEAANLRFAGLHPSGFAPARTIWKDAPDRTAYAMRVDTDRGPRAAIVYADGTLMKRYRAALIEDGNEGPAATLTLSRAEHDEIVPAASR